VWYLADVSIPQSKITCIDLSEDFTDVLRTCGNGVDFVRRDTNHASVELHKLAARGVFFVACNNSLNQRSTSEAELFAFVTIVPGAIGELIRAQRDGRAYLKLV
jgi:intracellular sulfur oxidation DsrE/DsrF family protein